MVPRTAAGAAAVSANDAHVTDLLASTIGYHATLSTSNYQAIEWLARRLSLPISTARVYVETNGLGGAR